MDRSLWNEFLNVSSWRFTFEYRTHTWFILILFLLIWPWARRICLQFIFNVKSGRFPPTCIFANNCFVQSKVICSNWRPSIIKVVYVWRPPTAPYPLKLFFNRTSLILSVYMILRKLIVIRTRLIWSRARGSLHFICESLILWCKWRTMFSRLECNWLWLSKMFVLIHFLIKK